MALSRTYELLAGQEPFRGMIATGEKAGEKAGGLKRLQLAVRAFLKGKGIALDEARGRALAGFEDEERLTALFSDLAGASDPEAVFAAFDRTIASGPASADTKDSVPSPHP